MIVDGSSPEMRAFSTAMADSLGGARVALLEARRESELASLVRRHGGTPVCVPALREVELDCDLDAGKAIDALGSSQSIVVLATGAGLEGWMAAAARLGRSEELHGGLARATVVCRGPKPIAVLKREGLSAHVRASPPHTTAQLLEALAGVEVKGRAVVFVHDGGGARAVPDAMERRGGQVFQLQPYGWALPEDVAPLRELIGNLVDGQVEALAVTTQVQARHLFEVASAMGLRDRLSDALRDKVIVAAVGPTTARALSELGAPAHVVAQPSTMGATVLALARALSA